MSINDESKPQRVAKLIAAAGICSRRDAEKLIAEGRVKVNGKVITTPATLITDHAIKVDDKLINPKTNKKPRLWLFHKPKGVITTSKDPEGRKTVFDILPKYLPRVITVGRLDFNTEGLLLLTDSGELSRQLELPQNGFVRKYRVRVFGRIDQERLQRLQRGITVDGVRYKPMKATLDSQKEANSWLIVEISEGKNREIRKIMEHLGLTVSRLIRIEFGPYRLGNLAIGDVKEIKSLIS